MVETRQRLLPRLGRGGVKLRMRMMLSLWCMCWMHLRPLTGRAPSAPGSLLRLS